MNLKDQNYAQFALVREMMDTVETIRKFDPDCTKQIAEQVKQVGNIYFTGEGSSRIFPAKNSLRKFKRWGMDVNIQTDGSWQSREYDLSKYAVFLASNSGRTKEVTLLAKKLMEEYEGSRIVCVDSLNASMGEGMLAIEAAKMANVGASIDEIEKHILSVRKNVNQYVTVHSLDALKRAGRVKGPAAFFGNLMGVKPILISDANGDQAAYKKVKGRQNSFETMAKGE